MHLNAAALAKETYTMLKFTERAIYLPTLAGLVFLTLFSQSARGADPVASTAENLQRSFAKGSRYVIGIETPCYPTRMVHRDRQWRSAS